MAARITWTLSAYQKNDMKLSAILNAILMAFLVLSSANSQDLPITGKEVAYFAPIDKVVIGFMDTIDATSASLSVAHNGKVVYSRAFGWSDENKKEPTTTDSTFRIASNTKPITAALVHELFRQRTLSPSTGVFEYLAISPYNNKPAEAGLSSITIEHLLAHRGGWDKTKNFDPMYRLETIKKEIKTDSLTKKDIAEYMFAQPLDFQPDTKRAYSNFGYLLLGLIIEKATKMTYEKAVETAICSRLKIEDIQLSRTDSSKRADAEVFYPNESGLEIPLRDSVGGLSASSSSLCVFLDRYWMNGERRERKENRFYYHFGSHPNSTTSLMEQRDDGIDYVVLFNSRRNEHYNDDNKTLRTGMNNVISEITATAQRNGR